MKEENQMSEKIVFMGTPEFAAHVLESLIRENYEVVGVVCQEDKKIGRKQILTAPPVKEVALKYGIEVFQPHRIRLDYEKVKEWAPDLIITSAYGQIIPKEVLDIPRYHCINTHASLLPLYRGAAPIQRAIMNGEKVTGMTIMYMNEKMDEGDILMQKEVEITKEETNASLFEKLSYVTVDMLKELLPKIFREEVTGIPQDHEQATYAPMLKKEEEFISFHEDIEKVYDHIRGLLDNPGAYGILENKKYKFLKVSCERGKSDPGVFKGLEKDYLRIDAEGGFLKVYKLKPEGKNEMDARAFHNGAGRNLIGKMFQETL